MSDNYSFKYTNGYANYGKVDKDELKIDGVCKITNFDPRSEEGKNKGQITIDFSDEGTVIKTGTGSGHKNTEIANFSRKKYSKP